MPCIIRPWRIEDAASLAGNLNDPAVLNNLRDGLPFPYTEADAEAFIRTMLAADKNNTFSFAVEAENTAIGSIGVFRRENVHCRTAELGYYIGRPYWGRGYMTCAVEQICRHVFSHSDILRIFAEPYARNVASCRVLEKAGFQLEGTLRSNAVKNGEVLDMKLYALVRHACFSMFTLSKPPPGSLPPRPAGAWCETPYSWCAAGTRWVPWRAAGPG